MLENCSFLPGVTTLPNPAETQNNGADTEKYMPLEP